MMADLVETMHHVETGIGVSKGRRICHQPLCLPDNNRIQYFMKIKYTQHAQQFTVLIKGGAAGVGDGDRRPEHSWWPCWRFYGNR
jgi:hypothetical protein